MPLTTGAAMLVPLNARYGLFPDGLTVLLISASGLLYIVLPGTASDNVPVPGATRSGFALQSRNVGPCEL